MCRPAVRPATGAHTGAPLPMVIGSGRKPDSPLSHGFAVPAPPEGEPLRAGEPRPYAMKWVRLETDGGLIHVIAGSEATRQSASPFCASHRAEKENGFPRQGCALPRNDRGTRSFLIPIAPLRSAGAAFPPGRPRSGRRTVPDAGLPENTPQFSADSPPAAAACSSPPQRSLFPPPCR